MWQVKALPKSHSYGCRELLGGGAVLTQRQQLGEVLLCPGDREARGAELVGRGLVNSAGFTR